MSGSQESPDTGKVCECVSGVPRYRKSVRVGVRSPQIQEKCASGGQESLVPLTYTQWVLFRLRQWPQWEVASLLLSVWSRLEPLLSPSQCGWG